MTSEWLQRRYPCRGYSAGLSDVQIVPLEGHAKSLRESRLRALSAGARPQLGTVASLAGRYKGVQTAIAALGLLRRRGYELRYSVVGSGERRRWGALADRHGVGDLVTFEGPLAAGAVVRAWLDRVDIYLQPSFHEGLPRATIEAMSRGAACVTSNCGGLPELIPSERMHRPGDAETLAELVLGMVLRPDRVAAASSADRQRAQAYSPQALKQAETAIFGRLREAVVGTGKSCCE